MTQNTDLQMPGDDFTDKNNAIGEFLPQRQNRGCNSLIQLSGRVSLQVSPGRPKLKAAAARLHLDNVKPKVPSYQFKKGKMSIHPRAAAARFAGSGIPLLFLFGYTK
jgi:hypothetical protein